MIDLFEFYIENPLFIWQNNVGRMFRITYLMVTLVPSDLDDWEISKICPTFDNDRVMNFLLNNQMIMAS